MDNVFQKQIKNNTMNQWIMKQWKLEASRFYNPAPVRCPGMTLVIIFVDISTKIEFDLDNSRQSQGHLKEIRL
jgi:hypothetical protein